MGEVNLFLIQNTSFESFPNVTHKLDLHFLDLIFKFWLGLIFVTVMVLYKNRQKTEKNQNVLKFEDIPGPKAVPIFGNILTLLPMKKALNIGLNISQKFGECFQFTILNEKFVILNSPEMAQSFLKSGNAGHVTKSPFVRNLLRPFIVNGVLISEGSLWKTERKILSRFMFMSNLREYFPTMVKQSWRFVTSIEKLSKDQQPHAINDLVNISFLEVIIEFLTGADVFGTQTGSEYHHNFETWKGLMTYRMFHPWLLIDILWKFHPLRQKQMNAVKGMIKFSKQRLMECKSARQNAVQTTTFRTMLDTMLDAGVSDELIIDEINTMMFGGHDTTAAAIQFFLLMMALNPNHQELCRNEVDQIFDAANGTLNFEVLSEFKYLERCIQETLRNFPVVMCFARKLEAPLEIDYNKKKLHLEPGINIAIFPWFLHKNPESFPNPDVFDPDRFSPEECANRHSHAYLPFSAGPRNCLGIKFSMMQLKLVAAHVLHKFEVTTIEKMEDIVLLPNTTLGTEKDFRFIFKNRRNYKIHSCNHLKKVDFQG